MKYVIYMDVFFGVNMVMDFILLRITASYIKPQTTILRCMVGAIIGSGITCLELLLPYKVILLHMLISYVFTVIAMVYITFGKCRIKKFFKRCGYLYLITIFLGGIANLLYSYTDFGYMVSNIFNTVFATRINILRLAIITLISYGIMIALFQVLKKKRNKNYVVVLAIYRGREVRLRGLIDSGNSLIDPYYKKPVHIIEFNKLQKVFDISVIQGAGYRLVPFRSLGQDNGLIEVVELDKIKVYEYADSEDSLGREKCMYEEDKPAFGLYKSILSSDGEYDVLLNKCVEEV